MTKLEELIGPLYAELEKQHDCANCLFVMEEYDLARPFRNREDVLRNIIY